MADLKFNENNVCEYSNPDEVGELSLTPGKYFIELWGGDGQPKDNMNYNTYTPPGLNLFRQALGGYTTLRLYIYNNVKLQIYIGESGYCYYNYNGESNRDPLLGGKNLLKNDDYSGETIQYDNLNSYEKIMELSGAAASVISIKYGTNKTDEDKIVAGGAGGIAIYNTSYGDGHDYNIETNLPNDNELIKQSYYIGGGGGITKGKTNILTVKSNRNTYIISRGTSTVHTGGAGGFIINGTESGSFTDSNPIPSISYGKIVQGTASGPSTTKPILTDGTLILNGYARITKEKSLNIFYKSPKNISQNIQMIYYNSKDAGWVPLEQIYYKSSEDKWIQVFSNTI